MKIAILISGYLRGFSENIQKIKENIIQDNDYDIYMHITNNHEEKYYNNEINIEFIKKTLNPKICIVSDNLHFSEHTNINNLLNQNYKYYWLNEERKKISDIENITYDIVIKIRPDTHIKTKLNYTIDPSYVYIPRESKIDKTKLQNVNDKHICDIIAYGTPEIMDLYFDYYMQLKVLIQKYRTIVNETLLYHYLYNNIQYKLIDINFFVILSLCNTIAITGDSGSGKTTISNILKNCFNNSFVLECDRYHKWERDNTIWENITHLNPDANYITKMTNDVFNLKIGNTIHQVDYNHSTGKFSDSEKIESKDNIIVCGLHSLYISDNIINLKIYMETDDNLRIPWKIKRDIHRRGYSIEKIISQIEKRKNDFEKYILPQKKNADIIIHLYTDTVFDHTNFDIDNDYNVFLRIGIKPKYNINNIILYLKIQNILEENDFIYLYFNSDFHYENVIKTIITNLYLK